MTREQFEVLDKHKELIEMAYNTHTVRGATVEVKKELMEVYVALGYRKTSISCNTCVIDWMSTLCYLYNKELEAQKQALETIKEEESTESTTDKKEPVKMKGNKNGRKKV